MTDKFENFETPVCADWLNQVDRSVYVALGGANTVQEAQEVLGIDAVANAWVIDANLILYVDVAGNDTTGDGTMLAPWATLAKAVAYLAPATIISGVTVTIQLSAGDFVFEGTLSFSHPQGSQIIIKGAAATGSITGIVQADFTDPLNPVPGTRGAFELYNSAGMLPTNASTADRTAARAVDAPANLALLQSCYPTRISNGASAFAINVYSPLGGLQDILFLGSRLTVSGGTLNVATSLASCNSASIPFSVNNGGYLNAAKLVIGTGTGGSGIRVQSGGVAEVPAFYVQGMVDGIQVQRSGVMIIADVSVSGCSGNGAYISAGSALNVTTVTNTKKEIVFSGNGIVGVGIEGNSSFLVGRNGTGGNFMRFRGNVQSQLSALFGSTISISSSSLTLDCQGSPTNGALFVSGTSRFSCSTNMTITGGLYGIQLSGNAFFNLTAALVVSDSTGQTMNSPINIDSGIARFAGAITLPPTIGNAGVVATNGGIIIDSVGNLATLAASSPTKFTPRLGDISSQGSQIVSGPVSTAALNLVGTAATLKGSTVKLEALAGTGTRTVMVAADGTLSAV